MKRRDHIPNSMIQRAQELRRTPTRAERALWRLLRGRQLSGAKFRRQQTIDRYVVDFYCTESRLVVETDGLSRDGRAAYDQERVRQLEALGLAVLRFLDGDVLNRGIDVANEIVRMVELRRGCGVKNADTRLDMEGIRANPPPSPPPQGGRV